MNKEFTPEKIDKLIADIKAEAERRKREGQKEQPQSREVIKIGDRVRCFTFYGNKNIKGKNSHYIEGVVRAIDHNNEKYEVIVEKEVVFGEEDESRMGDLARVDISPEIVKKIP